MKHYYGDVLRALEMPTAVVKLAEGSIPSPLNWECPAEWYGYPPALIPILSDGSGPTYYGIWHHWFTTRKPSFVKMYVDANRLVVELARTAEQFFCHIALAAIVTSDDVTSEIHRFSDRVGISDLDEINSVSLSSGDDPLGLAQLRQFSVLTPLESVRDRSSYSGDFPYVSDDSSVVNIENACSFELEDRLISLLSRNHATPRWLFARGDQEMFNEFLAAGDLRAAWLTLNSRGWSVKDTGDSLLALATKAKDGKFSLLVDAWLKSASS